MQGRHYLIRGRVQQVWFRVYTRDTAARLGIRGWVRNLHDGRVEVLAAGEDKALSDFEALLREGPEHARVDEVAVRHADPDGLPVGFEILSDSVSTDTVD